MPFVQSLKLLIHLGETHDTAGGNPAVPQFNTGGLGIYHVVIFILMTWTYGVGAPSGLFVPILTLGAAMGRLYGQGVLTFLQYMGISQPRTTNAPSRFHELST